MSGLIGTPHKRHRRTKAEIARLRDAIDHELAEHHPQSVRHVFYRMVVAGLVDKSEAGYSTVQVQLVNMRRNGAIPHDWITDGTRWVRRIKAYGSPAEAVEETARFYRRRAWADTEVYLEVWCESDSIAGVLLDITDSYAVPLFTSRGFSSLGFLYPSARGLAAAANGRPAIVLYVGDYDPSGVIIPQKIEAGLKEYAPEADIRFRRIAVNPDQVRTMNLPGKPAKASSHARSFTGQAVEAEAIPVAEMQATLENEITGFIDARTWNAMVAAEKSERQWLVELAQSVRQGVPHA